MPKNTLIIITGPSGVGKTTLVGRLLERIPSSAQFPTTTTRPPRPGEVDGIDYYFENRGEFMSGVERGEFIEWVESYGHCYGTSRSKLADAMARNNVVFAITDTRGAFSLKIEYPRAVTIFVEPASIEELALRIRSRASMNEEEFRKRIDAATKKMSYARSFDHSIINAEGALETALREIYTIVELHSAWRIGIDLDGVIIDHVQNKIAIAKELGVMVAVHETPSQILRTKMPPELYKKLQHAIYDDPMVALRAEPMSGAKEQITSLTVASHLWLISLRPTSDTAISWLSLHGLWDSHFNERNTFFVKTREEKNRVAQKIAIDVYIDDEPDTLAVMHDVPHRFLLDPLDVYPDHPEYSRVKSWEAFTDQIAAL